MTLERGAFTDGAKFIVGDGISYKKTDRSLHGGVGEFPTRRGEKAARFDFILFLSEGEAEARPRAAPPAAAAVFRIHRVCRAGTAQRKAPRKPAALR